MVSNFKYIEGDIVSKRGLALTEAKIEKFEKEGRGTGTGAQYKPWITIQDFPSSGLAIRCKGWKTNRIHHFLSKLEQSYFYLMEWSPSVIDIREQFPLTREDTLYISQEKGIKHPVDTKTKVPIVMTTDFLITISTMGGHKHLARTVKLSKELETERVLAKFEIERSYWEQRNIEWGIVTERELPKSMIENIQWLHTSYFDNEELPAEVTQTYLEYMEEALKQSDMSIIEFVTQFDKKYQLESGRGLELLKYLFARQKVPINIQNKIQTHLKLSDVILFDKW